MFALISRFFHWLHITRRRISAIRNGVALVVRAAGTIPPRALPKYLLAFTDADEDPVLEHCDTFMFCTGEKLPSDLRIDAKGNVITIWLRDKCNKFGLRRRSKRYEECCVCHEDRSVMASVCQNDNAKAPHEACLKCINNMKQWGLRTCHICRGPTQFQKQKIRKC